MKVWTTKYALTGGIVEVEVEDRGGGMVRALSTAIQSGMAYYGPKQWYLTEQEAKIEAEKMRLKKIISVKKQLAKLEKMRF